MSRSARVRQALLAALCLIAGPLASAAGEALDDFAFGRPVVAGAAGAAYRVSLPLNVYQYLAREDLGDIRVFNARGEIVPYDLSRPTAPAPARGAEIALPLFALRGDSPAAADAVRVTIDSPNAAVKLQTQRSGPAAGGVRQYILDGRSLTTEVIALQLAWPDAAQDFTGRLRVDASDDFSAWRTLADAAPIANLHANGQQLVRNRIELAPARAKYWRLSWIGRAAPFELTAVSAEPGDSRVEAERRTLDIAGDPRAAASGEYSFDLQARLPIERVDLALPEINTVAAVELLSRMHPADPWRRVAARQFYRVDTADGELHNQPISIAGDSDRYWLARPAVPIGTRPGQPLRLRIEWTASDVVFLARGPGPFLLAYGSAVAPAAETNLSSVSASVTVLPATLGERGELGGAARLAPPVAEFPWKRFLLWAVLGASVCMLAWMAYRLTKEAGGTTAA